MKLMLFFKLQNRSVNCKMLFFTFILLIVQIFSINGVSDEESLYEGVGNENNLSEPKNRNTEAFYTVNITRDLMKPYDNDLIKSTDVSTRNSYITFSQKMDTDNALIILKANISIRGIQIWDSETKNAMKNLCDNSYPDGSVEENVSKIVSETILGYLECPVEKRTYRTLPYKLNQQTLHFNKRIPCGIYKMDVTVDTKDLKRVLDLTFSWVIPFSSNCEKDPFIIK